MIYRLEKWTWWGGALLAGNAGMINAVGLRSFAQQAVTHVTGTTSLFALSLAHGDTQRMVELGLVLLSFAGGAALGGFIIGDAVLKLGRRYGVALLLEGALLASAAWLMQGHVVTGSYLASAACGLQNAMASTYSGAVLRTTHLSGMFTDLGAAFGHFLRRAKVDAIRVKLYGLLVGSFLAGGIAGSLLFDRYSSDTLYVPAAFTGAVAVSYMLYAHAARPRVKA